MAMASSASFRRLARIGLTPVRNSRKSVVAPLIACDLGPNAHVLVFMNMLR